MAVIATYIVPHPPLIIPGVGKGQEKAITKTIDAYQSIGAEIGGLNPETLVIITPHSIMYQDYIHISPGAGARGDLKKFADYKTSFSVKYDSDLVARIEDEAGKMQIPAGTLGERDKKLDHGTTVPLYFIDQHLSDYQIVRISVSGLTLLDHYRFGKCVKAAAEKLGRKIVVVASGDLSHKLKEEGPYSYAEEGPAFDRQVTEAMDKGDFLNFMDYKEEFIEAAGECGLRGFVIMAGTLDGFAVEAKLLSYEGPFGVGYGLAKFYPRGRDDKRKFDMVYQQKIEDEIGRIRRNENDYVRLARLSLESYVKERKKINQPLDISPELTEKMAGVFVTLKKEGRLRGCIGTINPTEASIADEIIRNAISAGTGDPRFDPVTLEELNDLVYSVDVLGDPEPIVSMEELDVNRYGVIVSKGRKRGLLLPNLEGIRTVEQQVEIALEKAGIFPEDNYRMERFEVVRHK